MNTYTFEEIQPGMSESFEARITEEMMDNFKNMTGDVNPLHCSDDYAIQRGYRSRVVYGMLTSALYSTLAGVYLPGQHCLLHSVETKMLKPVYIGDKLKIEGTVTDKHDIFKTIEVKALITNQNNEKISKAIIQIGINF